MGINNGEIAYHFRVNDESTNQRLGLKVESNWSMGIARSFAIGTLGTNHFETKKIASIGPPGN